MYTSTALSGYLPYIYSFVKIPSIHLQFYQDQDTFHTYTTKDTFLYIYRFTRIPYICTSTGFTRIPYIRLQALPGYLRLYQDTLHTCTCFTRIHYVRLQALPGYLTYVYRLYQDILHTSTGFTRIHYILVRLQALPGYFTYVYRLYQDTLNTSTGFTRIPPIIYRLYLD